MTRIALKISCIVTAVLGFQICAANAVEYPILNSKAAITAAKEVCRQKAGASRKWIAGLDRDKQAWSVITMPENRKGKEQPWVTNIPVFGEEERLHCENAYYYSFAALHGGSEKIDALEMKLEVQQRHAEGAECLLPPGGSTSLNIEDFPEKLRKTMPGLGGVDQPYRSDGTPGNTALPSAHLIRIYRRDNRWVVLYGTEAGLGELNRSLLVLDTYQDGSFRRRVSDEKLKSHRDLCRLVANHLSKP